MYMYVCLCVCMFIPFHSKSFLCLKLRQTHTLVISTVIYVVEISMLLPSSVIWSANFKDEVQTPMISGKKMICNIWINTVTNERIHLTKKIHKIRKLLSFKFFHFESIIIFCIRSMKFVKEDPFALQN